MLDQGDLGHRVVVRRQAGAGSYGRALFTDVLGDLISLDDGEVTIRTDRGTLITIPAVEVHAAKRIPPRPAKHSEIAALELVATRAWPAPVVERLGDWLLRFADGWTSRANSALPVGDAGMPIEDAITACEWWYSGRGQPAMIAVPLPLRRDIDRALTARAWQPQPVVLTQVASLADIVARTPSGAILTERPTPALLAAVGARRGPLPGCAIDILTGPDQVMFAEVRSATDALLASARSAVVDGWMHLGLLEVAEAARRRGLAQQVIGSLARWAVDHGAAQAVLQVEERLAPAVALYERLAFRTHHRYITYRAPTAA